MATLGIPPRLHIPEQKEECVAHAGLAAATPRVAGEELACSLSISHDSTLDAAAAAALAEQARETTDQPATATSAPTAVAAAAAAPAPVTLIARQRPRKHSSPAASSPTASSGAKCIFQAETAAPLPRRRCVLVAKQLTNSDANSGRIILPRVAVESNLSFVLGYRHYALAVKDCHGRRYEFMIKSWANGTEHRRVFVLEQAGEFLRAHGVGVGDAVGICTDEHGELVVEANTEEVRQATVSPKYGALALQAPPPGATAAVPLVAGAAGRCIRSPHCTKAAGHPGFCSGPKAAAAAAAKQHKMAAAVVAAAHHYGGGHHHHHQQQQGGHQLRGSCQPGTSDVSARGAAAASNSTSGEEAATRLATPRSGGARHAFSTATAGAEAPGDCGEVAAATAQLPEGLHEVADIPTGLRICKVLTAYDLSSRRVVMPAPEVQAGVPNAATTDRLTLAAVDESQRWHFPTLHAWTNVASRRGYLLVDLADWLANRGAQEGDCLAVFRNCDASPPRVELLPAGALAGAAPKQPAAVESAAPTFASLPLLLHPKGAVGPAASCGAGGAHGRGLVLLTHRRGVAGSHHGGAGAAVCRRTSTCTKPAGHQGFCSGHKGFKRRESPTASSALGVRRPFGRSRPSHDDDWVSDDDAYLTASDDDSSPSYSARSRAAKRPRRGGAAAAVAAAVAAVAASRDGTPTPAPAPPAACDPLLSLLSALDTIQPDAGVAAAAVAPAGTCPLAAAEQAVLTAEAAAHAAYGVAKVMAA